MSKDHAVMPSIEVFYTMLWCTCLLLCGVEVATSSISNKETATQYHKRSGNHFKMQVELSISAANQDQFLARVFYGVSSSFYDIISCI